MSNESCPVKEQFKTMIGGQALIEGIMMRGPEKQAIVVRHPSEGLKQKVEPLKKKSGVLTWPLIRGIVNFGGSMFSGVKSLMWSAENSGFDEEEGEEEPSKLDQWLERKLGSEKYMSVLITVSVILGMGFSVLLFFLLPMELGNLFQRLTGCGVVLQHLFEGLCRIGIFLVYMIGISKLKDMRRVFSYHGAEHKTIRCYEARLPLTVENVRPMTRLHPRCGTSFLFVVMVISILVFSVFTSIVHIRYKLLKMLFKLMLLPIVVAISYEINRFVGRHDNWFTRAISWPGMWLQNFTTNEPDDSMIEVAIRSIELVTPEKEGADEW